MLKNQIGISTYPQKISGGRWRDKAIPRAFSMTDVTKIIVQLAGKDDYRIVFVESYFHLIVSDEDYAKQLWSLGNAYVPQSVGCKEKRGSKERTFCQEANPAEIRKPSG